MGIRVTLKRLGYRVAYRLLQAYWYVRRPATMGVKCVLTDGDHVLLVRHTYGDRRWDLPGGTLRSGEEPDAAARREMAEELGLALTTMTSLGSFQVNVDHRADRLHCFAAEVGRPQIELQLAELSEAHWFPRDELPAQLARFVTPVLSRAAGS